MKLSEVVLLLAYIRTKAGPAYGGMVFPPGTAESWHEDLEDILLDDARLAIREHFRVTSKIPGIAEIRNGVNRIRVDRIDRAPAINPAQIRQTSPGPDWFDVKDQLAQRRQRRKGDAPASLGETLADMAEQVEREGNAT